MDTVTESRLAIAMAQQGGLGDHPQEPVDRGPGRGGRQGQALGVRHDRGPGDLPPRADASPRRSRSCRATRSRACPSSTIAAKLVGILTNRDLRFETRTDRPISARMTKKNLITTPVGTTLEQAKELLHKYRIEKLLVVDRGGNLKGLITVKDIQKAIKYPNAAKDALGRLRVGGGDRRHQGHPRSRPGARPGQGRRPRPRLLARPQPGRPRRAEARPQALRLDADHRRQRRDRGGRPRSRQARRRRHQGRHRPGLDLHHARRHGRRRPPDSRHPRVRARPRGERRCR